MTSKKKASDSLARFRSGITRVTPAKRAQASLPPLPRSARSGAAAPELRLGDAELPGPLLRHPVVLIAQVKLLPDYAHIIYITVPGQKTSRPHPSALTPVSLPPRAGAAASRCSWPSVPPRTGLTACFLFRVHRPQRRPPVNSEGRVPARQPSTAAPLPPAASFLVRDAALGRHDDERRCGPRRRPPVANASVGACRASPASAPDTLRGKYSSFTSERGAATPPPCIYRYAPPIRVCNNSKGQGRY